MEFYKVKKNKLWIWKAYNRTDKKLIGWECGKRDKSTLLKLLQRLSKWNVSIEKTEYYLHDEMGSVIRITDKEGKNKRIFQYNAFGDMKDFGEKFDRERILLSFTGYEVEKDFSLMYAQARYYMPEIGRFKEEDSNRGNGFIPESLNYYSYCYNNPLMYVDKDGCVPVKITDIFTERVEKVTKEYQFSYDKYKREWSSKDR